MPKKINFNMTFDDNELFDEELMKAVRAKISEIMRSEFDKLAKEQCEKIIKSRLDSNYYDNPLKLAAKDLLQEHIRGWKCSDKENPIMKAINENFDKHFSHALEKTIQEEVEKRLKERVKKMKEIMNVF